MRLTVDFDSVASGPSASASAASTSRSLKPRTQPEIANASNAFVRVTCLPSRREANRSSMPRSFSRRSPTGPAVVRTVMSP
jgi:hypothetical protein